MASDPIYQREWDAFHDALLWPRSRVRVTTQLQGPSRQIGQREHGRIIDQQRNTMRPAGADPEPYISFLTEGIIEDEPWFFSWLMVPRDYMLRTVMLSSRQSPLKVRRVFGYMGIAPSAAMLPGEGYVRYDVLYACGTKAPHEYR